MLSRRAFLRTAVLSGASLALAQRPRAEGGPLRLTPQQALAQLLPSDAPATPIWGYNGQVPGPVIRAKAGERVQVEVENGLDLTTSVHWHGIRIDNAMDGVAYLTQEPIAPGTRFLYDFVVPDPGTYWYHPHDRSWEQVARGLYGALIVEEPKPLPVDREILMLVDDWRLSADGRLHEESFGNMRDASHAGRLGNVLTIDAQDFAEIPVRAGERLRLRIVNTANARVFELGIARHDMTLLALDGQPVAGACGYSLRPQSLVLAPGARADVLLDCTGSPGERYEIAAFLRDGPLALGTLVYSDEEPLEPGRHGHVEAVLPPNRNLPQPDLEKALEVPLVMQGGAMGGLPSARYKGREMDLRSLVELGQVWAFNGVAGMPEQPLFTARRGQSVVVNMVNDTAWPHAIHLHGHHARPLCPGSEPRFGPWRDSILLAPDERLPVAFVADNPGRWMLHCHMLEHQAAGMATWFEVAG